MISAKLQPTLWRTCRVLANRTRLKMFALLAREPRLAVSQVASRLGVARPIASTYLRALESRGLLEVHRRAAWVQYQLKQNPMESAAGSLLAALVTRVKRDARCLDALYGLATAFANPGRIQVFRLLAKRPQGMRELRTATHLNVRTIMRHLRKLEARGFVARERVRGKTHYRTRVPRDVFGRALADMAKA